MKQGELPQLPRRERNDHKGKFGRAFLVGGSRGMSGAVGLAAMAAQRAGAGLVTAVVPDRCLETVASFSPNYTTLGFADDRRGRFLSSSVKPVSKAVSSATSLGLGPGLARGTDLTEFVGQLYASLPCPVVVDADALNALADERQNTRLCDAEGTRILTPHIGEFQRLIGLSLGEAACRERAAEFAAEHNVIIVLKGPGTIVTDGERYFENTTGNPGMATGGSGDVLTGVITALLGQFDCAFQATVAAVHLHGLAGDLAADRLGQISLVASDLVEHLPAAFQCYAHR